MPFFKVRLPNKEIKKFKLKHGMTIGRGRKNHLRLDDAGVSRHHAQVLFLPNDEVLISDLGSSNGIRINGKRVQEQKLEHKDLIVIGSTRFLFLARTKGDYIDLSDILPSVDSDSLSNKLFPEEEDDDVGISIKTSSSLEDEFAEEVDPMAKTGEMVLKTTERLKPKKAEVPEEESASFDIDALLESGDQELIDLFLDEE